MYLHKSAQNGLNTNISEQSTFTEKREVEGVWGSRKEYGTLCPRQGHIDTVSGHELLCFG